MTFPLKNLRFPPYPISHIFRGAVVMYDSTSCSYAGALDLKGAGSGTVASAGSGVKQENWPYRGLACGIPFQQLKQSVEKAKQALADRGGYLAGAFSPPPRANPAAISPNASITGELLYVFSLCILKV